MRVNGKWLPCDDDVTRPLIGGLVRLPDGSDLEVAFLLDAGADRTVFSPDLYPLLQPLEVMEDGATRLTGVGGEVNSTIVETVLSFRRDDGRLVAIRGTFAVFMEGQSIDLSVLGRDVTNNFGVIYDYPNQTVALLAPPHFYEIKS